mmetsp:Transcript_9367/g.30812  ORF Transcript_9367/g.30812 Transcript_9367/m.30812 type:complete len:213 (-) Transcript_9367:183-821(-)
MQSPSTGTTSARGSLWCWSGSFPTPSGRGGAAGRTTSSYPRQETPKCASSAAAPPLRPTARGATRPSPLVTSSAAWRPGTRPSTSRSRPAASAAGSAPSSPRPPSTRCAGTSLSGPRSPGGSSLTTSTCGWVTPRRAPPRASTTTTTTTSTCSSAGARSSGSSPPLTPCCCTPGGRCGRCTPTVGSCMRGRSAERTGRSTMRRRGWPLCGSR